MRKLYVFLLMVLVEACSPSGYEIDGTVNGISEGKVYMPWRRCVTVVFMLRENVWV